MPHDVAVLVVHHARKNGSTGTQAGLSLRGSGDFHAWGDSNLYVRRLKDPLLPTIEHCAAAAPDPLRLQLVAGEDVDVHLAIASTTGPAEVEPPSERDRRVLDLLALAGRPKIGHPDTGAIRLHVNGQTRQRSDLSQPAAAARIHRATIGFNRKKRSAPACR